MFAYRRECISVTPGSFRNLHMCVLDTPISLTSHMGKLMERIIANRLSWWMKEKGIINEYQAGFRARRNTVDQFLRRLIVFFYFWRGSFRTSPLIKYPPTHPSDFFVLRFIKIFQAQLPKYASVMDNNVGDYKYDEEKNYFFMIRKWKIHIFF
ncbi:hypothetical protein HELRODRAFT_178739 [Helobdella robusta]|uniref:Reverse transcriptase domain-containing protein n=1 Tax=Helobdella robusta TaxID=6412 RepID=T1FDN4_HELRO|nr:hypothetical protein HELRODRAFT_178739 [Helobdella robusta]ESN96939.1 hypothetical protein HELRODRAFT_178739 [Helobdella robusta]